MSGCDLHETFEIKKSSQAVMKDNDNLCESTRKRKEQNDDPVDQTLPSLPNCDNDTKGITSRETSDINDANIQMEASNGEKAFESNSPDAKLVKVTSTEMSGTNLNFSGNPSETSSIDVDMRPASPECKEPLSSNSSACPDLQESHSSVGPVVEPKPPVPSSEAVDNITEESEVTPMETEDTEGQNSGADAFVPENVVQNEPDSNQTQASSSERYCCFWKYCCRKWFYHTIKHYSDALILKVGLLLIIIFINRPIKIPCYFVEIVKMKICCFN